MTKRYKRVINGNTYNIHVKKGIFSWKVTIGVWRTNYAGNYWGKTDVTDRLWFPDDHTDESKWLAELLNEAVCNREGKIDSRTKHQNRINNRLDIVAEEHESP